MKRFLRLPIASLIITMATAAETKQPNVLWIVTDDQRYDSIRAFNKIIDGREMSELGYVESPEVDKLAARGTTFINTYCHSAVCAPSRAAMHFGRYPWHSGIYQFEYHNSSAEPWILISWTNCFEGRN